MLRPLTPLLLSVFPYCLKFHEITRVKWLSVIGLHLGNHSANHMAHPAGKYFHCKSEISLRNLKFFEIMQIICLYFS